jgi:hypothetical protein
VNLYQSNIKGYSKNAQNLLVLKRVVKRWVLSWQFWVSSWYLLERHDYHFYHSIDYQTLNISGDTVLPVAKKRKWLIIKVLQV